MDDIAISLKLVVAAAGAHMCVAAGEESSPACRQAAGTAVGSVAGRRRLVRCGGSGGWQVVCATGALRRGFFTGEL